MLPLFYILLMNNFLHKDFYAVLAVVCFLYTLLNKEFITCVIRVSFVFSSELFIFSIGTFTSSNLFVLESDFGNESKNFDNCSKSILLHSNE